MLKTQNLSRELELQREDPDTQGAAGGCQRLLSQPIIQVRPLLRPSKYTERNLTTHLQATGGSSHRPAGTQGLEVGAQLRGAGLLVALPSLDSGCAVPPRRPAPDASWSTISTPSWLP